MPRYNDIPVFFPPDDWVLSVAVLVIFFFILDDNTVNIRNITIPANRKISYGYLTSAGKAMFYNEPSEM